MSEQLMFSGTLIALGFEGTIFSFGTGFCQVNIYTLSVFLVIDEFFIIITFCITSCGFENLKLFWRGKKKC
jgi:hypothetical protein